MAPRAFDEVFLDHAEILAVGTEEEVEDIPRQRDRPKQRVKDQIPDDVNMRRDGQFVARRCAEGVKARDTGDRIARHRHEAEHGVEPERNAGNPEARVHQV